MHHLSKHENWLPTKTGESMILVNQPYPSDIQLQTTQIYVVEILIKRFWNAHWYAI